MSVLRRSARAGPTVPHRRSRSAKGSRRAGPTDVGVDAATAKKFDLAIGDTITILFQGPPQEFTITGILGFGEADNLAGATLAAFDVATAQKVLDKVGEFDQIDVVADEGTSVPDLRTSIQAELPKGIEAVKSSDVADEQAKQLQEALGFFRTALLVFAFIALFVGAFIIFNTFSIIVAQRTRELALLRAIGASRGQVMTSVVVEAFVTGLLASALGLIAGIGIAIALKGLLSAFGIDLPSTSLQLEPRTVVVAFVVGTVVTIISSIFPARRAARVAPVQALRESADSASGSLRRRLIVGLDPHRRRGGGAPLRAVRQPVERRLADRPGGRGDVRRHRDPVAARRAPARGGDRGPDPPSGDPGQAGS